MKKSSVKKIFERCIILNVLYCVLASVFSVLVLRDNLQGSTPLTLIPLIGAFVVFLLCIPEPFLCVDGGGRFMPAARFIIFFGKVLLLVLFEATAMIFKNFTVLYCVAAVSTAAFLLFIFLAYRKYLKADPPPLLFVDYGIKLNAFKKVVLWNVLYYGLNTFALFYLDAKGGVTGGEAPLIIVPVCLISSSVGSALTEICGKRFKGTIVRKFGVFDFAAKLISMACAALIYTQVANGAWYWVCLVLYFVCMAISAFCAVAILICEKRVSDGQG